MTSDCLPHQELRKENANMFTLMEENDALRNETQTLRLRLECLGLTTMAGAQTVLLQLG